MGKKEGWRPKRAIILPSEKQRKLVRVLEVRELIPAKALIRMLSEVALAKLPGTNEWAYETKMRIDAAKILLPKAVPDLKAVQVDLRNSGGSDLPYEVLAYAARAATQYIADRESELNGHIIEAENTTELIGQDD